jgi:hypothetical protein
VKLTARFQKIRPTPTTAAAADASGMVVSGPKYSSSNTVQVSSH